jgi:hypothetical protein
MLLKRRWRRYLFVLVFILPFFVLLTRPSTAFTNCKPDNSQIPLSAAEIEGRLQDYNKWLQQIGALDKNGNISIFSLREARSRHIKEPQSFCNTEIVNVSFSGKHLAGIDFSYANLRGSDFSKTQLEDVSFEGACLIGANFKSSDLWAVTFNSANLWRTDFANTRIAGTLFRQSLLVDTDFSDADMRFIDFASAAYMAAKDPKIFISLMGLEAMTWSIQEWSEQNRELAFRCVAPPSDRQSFSLAYSDSQSFSLIRLRKMFTDSGYTDYAKRTTVAIEHGKYEEMMYSKDWLTELEGVTRYVIFGVSTSYGLYPSRALTFLIISVFCFSFIYWPVIAIKRRANDKGIFRILPDDRIVRAKGGYQLMKKKVQKIYLPWRRAYLYALLFSISSAFQLGWKDINIGAWVSRLQPREFALVAKGWVRSVAGIQTLVSLGLLVIWVLVLLSHKIRHRVFV